MPNSSVVRSDISVDKSRNILFLLICSDFFTRIYHYEFLRELKQSKEKNYTSQVARTSFTGKIKLKSNEKEPIANT